MKEWDKEKVIELMIEAGSIAFKYYKKENFQRVKKDKTLVTQADIEIENLFIKMLENISEDIYILGEETINKRKEDYVKKALKSTSWIIDPIDGTACYAAGIPLWGISLAFMDKGVIKEGCIYLVPFNELYITSNKELWCYKVIDNKIIEKEKVVPCFASSQGIIAVTQKITKYAKIKLPNIIHSLAVAVCPVIYLIRGGYLGYIGNLKIWDIAAGLVMLLNSGFEAFLADGTPLSYKITPSVIELNKGKNFLRFKKLAIFCVPKWKEFFLNSELLKVSH